jgi:hypothetical protein
MNRPVETGTGAMIHIPSFIKAISGVQTFIWKAGKIQFLSHRKHYISVEKTNRLTLLYMGRNQFVASVSYHSKKEKIMLCSVLMSFVYLEL